MILFLVYGFTVTFLHGTEGISLHCYTCTSVDDPRQCNATSQCHNHEVCIVTETIDDDFNFKYQLGCASQTVCEMGRKRSNKRSLSQQCCKQDSCNGGFPGTLTSNTTTTKETTTTTTAKTTTATTTTVRAPVSTIRTDSTTQSTSPPFTTTVHTTHHHNHHLHTDSGCLVENWIRYQRNFYFSSELVSRQRLPRNRAVEACKQCNMTLLSIHSSEEQLFVHTNLTKKNEIWLGLHGNVWMDGSPRDFSNWRDARHSSHRCIVMDTNQQWHSEHCDRSHLFVCKSCGYYEGQSKSS